MNKPLSLTAALVLHRRAYRETSMLVDFFTRDNGLVSAVCRGVRGGKSAKSAEKKSQLQPFQPLLLGLVGKRELKTLSSVETEARAFPIHGSGLFCAMYINELLNRVLPKEVAYPQIFDLYLASLLRLSQSQPLEPILREFELNLLDLLGYGFSWKLDWQSEQPIQPEQFYTFVAEQGFRWCQASNNSNNCFDGATLLRVSTQDWDAQSLLAAKLVMRMALRSIIGDKPLKSRELFTKMEQTS